MENKNTNNANSSFTKIIEELQGKFDKVFEYVKNLKEENESLKRKIALLEAENEALRQENEEMRKNGVVLFDPKDREELKNRITILLERLNQYL
ncbi:MAG: cell division protein ZapB [Candidatus Kryptonium sp.]